MGNLKEIGQAIQINLLGIGYALHRGHYGEAIGRTAMIPFNLVSQSKERDNAVSAVHQFDVKFSTYDGKMDLLMIDQNSSLPSPPTSLRESDTNYIAFLQRKGKNTDAARFQWRHNLRLIETIYALSEGETLMVFLPHGGKIEDGVALAQYTRAKDGASAQSRLLPKLNEEEGQQILEGLVNLGGEQANLREGQDSVLWSGVKLDDNLFNFTQRPEEVNSFLTGILGVDFLQREVPTCLDGESCSSSTGQAVAPELKPVVAVSLAGAGGGMGGGGGGGGSSETSIENDFLEKEVPVLAAPSFLWAAALPTTATLIDQSVDAEVVFTTALHSTVVKDNDNPISPVSLESAFSFFKREQNLGRPAVLENIQVAGKPFFVAPAATELIIEFEKMAAKAYTKTAQRELAISKIASNIYTKPVMDKSLNLATVKNLTPAASKQSVGREVSKTEKAWQAETENMVSGAIPTEQTFTVNQLRVTEQRPIFEKTVEELSLPLLEISSETAPVMVLRAALRPVVKVDENYNFEAETVMTVENEKVVDDEMILVDNELSVVREKKAMVEVDQEETKLFLVENFSVVSSEVVKTEKKPDFQIKKLVWRIKAPTSEPKEASILEFELPKDSKQRLYAFYHFLQKVVKKVVGQDAIRTRQVTVIAEKETVDLNLELVREIEYYLKLLRGKKYAQAFAFVN